MQLLTKTDALRFVSENTAVLDAAGNPSNPFASSVWMRHFIDQVVEDAWTVVAPELDGDGRALMLLYREAQSPSRCLALTNYYASLYSPMASTARDRPQAMAALVQQLSALRPRVGTVNFAPLDAASPDTAALSAALSEQGWYVRRYFCFGNWTLPCDGLSFERYMATRDSQLRNTHARKAKKLLATGTLQIAMRPDEVDAAMDAFDAVYAKSWKQVEPYPNFVRGWARSCAEQGWLRLGTVHINDVPIAAQFWFTIDRRAYIFKLAYDEAQAKWSAGTVLTAHMMQQALDVDRVVEIDYLTGDDAYKKSWMTQRRERIGLMACNLRSMPGLLAAATEFAGQTRARLRPRPAVVAA
ncbi:MAG: GNAT family N-acetyltransferase [Burkholderiaceae bacterium]|nr:GNAT family N-acetyltransferase [Burkholderiaceae bacterium]